MSTNHNIMANISTYFQILVLFFKLNALQVICEPWQNTDLNELFYSELEGFFSAKHRPTQVVHPVEVQGWPKPIPNLGQAVGVAVNPNHQPVIFHRGPRVWDATTFNESNHFQHVSEGPISVDTLLTLDADTGEVVDSWGSNLFYLPHGLSIDNYGYYYMTDVGLHQAFKFKEKSDTPLLVFGKKFEPGSGIHHLCKPTDIVVATTGEIFIADGYCNARIMKYDSNGNLLYILPRYEELLPLSVPHSITLIEEYDIICIADREHKRIVCPRSELKDTPMEGSPIMTIQEPNVGRVFAVTSYGNQVFAVNGPSLPRVQIRGLTIDPMEEIITDQWTTNEGFQNPHDVEVCHNTSSLYVTEYGPNRVWKFKLVPLY